MSALDTTGTHVLFLFRAGPEPGTPGLPGGWDRTSQAQSVTQVALAGLAKVPHPSRQTGPARVGLAWGGGSSR